MATMMRLYDTVDALETVRAWMMDEDNAAALAEAGGDIDAVPALRDLLEQAEGDYATKVERVGLYIRELVANAKAVAEEAQRLAARQKMYERSADSLKRYLCGQMLRAEIRKVEGKLVTVRVQNNPPSVRCTLPETALHSLYLKPNGSLLVTRIPEQFRVNADGVKLLAKDGQSLPEGFEIVQGSHVRIA